MAHDDSAAIMSGHPFMKAMSAGSVSVVHGQEVACGAGPFARCALVCCVCSRLLGLPAATGVKFTRATANFSCMLTIDVKFATLQNAECCMGTLMGWSLREFTNQMSGEAKRYTTRVTNPSESPPMHVDDRRKIHEFHILTVRYITHESRRKIHE